MPTQSLFKTPAINVLFLFEPGLRAGFFHLHFQLPFFMKKLFLTFLTTCVALGLSAQVNVTFKVDMTGLTVSPNGVHVAGSMNGWNTTATPMTDQGSGIFAVTLPINPGTDVEYKFLNGNAWGNEEAAPANCTVGGSNRIFTTPGSDLVLPTVVFGQCQSVVTKKRVTFRIDMTGQTVSANGVHVAGNFQGWNPGATVANPIGGNIYEAHADVLSEILAVQYKFINGNAWGTDESVSGACANSSNNRFYDISVLDSVVLPAYKFGTCEITEVTSVDVKKDVLAFRVFPSPSAGQVFLSATLPGGGEVRATVLDLAGRNLVSKVWNAMPAGETELEMDLDAIPNGLYLVRIETNGVPSTRMIQVVK